MGGSRGWRGFVHARVPPSRRVRPDSILYFVWNLLVVLGSGAYYYGHAPGRGAYPESITEYVDVWASRLMMRPKPSITDLPGEPVSRGSFASPGDSALLTGIFAGSLGSGQRLVVQHLAKAYEVSPTPVRESLVELVSLGLVECAAQPERDRAAVRSAGGERDQVKSAGYWRLRRFAAPAVESLRPSCRLWTWS